MLKLGHKWTQVDTSGQRCFGLLYLCTRNQNTTLPTLSMLRTRDKRMVAQALSNIR